MQNMQIKVSSKGMNLNMGNTQAKIDKRKEEARKRKRKQRKIEKSRIKPAMRKKILSGTCLALVILLVTGIIFSNTTYASTVFTAVKVGDVKITAAEYSYYYNAAFNQYYSTYTSYGITIDTSTSLKNQTTLDGTTPLDEYIQESAISTIQWNVSFSEAAKEAGVALEEEDLTAVEEAMTTLQETADEYGVSVDEFLKSSYGAGVTQELYRSIIERQQLAYKYYEIVNDGFEFSDSEIEEAFEADQATYQIADLRYQLFASTEETTQDETEETQEVITKEDALTSAEEFMASVESEDDFGRLSYDIANGDGASTAEGADYSTQALYEGVKSSSLDDNVAEWAFSDERTVGNMELIENADGTGYYVVYMVKTPYRYEYNTVNVRHVLISVGDSETSESTDAESTALTDEEALTKINEIYEEWKAGEATEDSFAALVEEYSEDTGSSTEGGLYEQVYKDQMTTEFNDWIFDEARQAGDTEIVKTDYGYHLIYFVGEDLPYWMVQVKKDLKTDAYDAYYEELTAKFETSTHWLGMRLRHEPLPVSS